MCGIAGLLDPSAADLEGPLRQMANALAHRGPDDKGLRLWPTRGVGLAHQRLSIIDLSTAGQQPMSNEDDSIWIVLNGEIYNYKQLRRDLEQVGHAFRSNSDTEVILHAYEEYGDDHVHHLRGMFAYAIYDLRPGVSDSTSGRLLLVRDRLGIKPLIYSWSNGRFAFASEIQALRLCGGTDLEIDHSALFDYLTYGYVPTPKTAYRGLRKLPAGHLLSISGASLDIRRYWDVDCAEGSAASSSSEAAAMVRETLEEAVAAHTVSDVPIGVFLSGGVDSSLVTAMVARAAAKPPATFSIGFDVEGHSETHFAKLVSDIYATSHHERIVRADSLSEMLALVGELYDEPYADGSAVPTHRLAQLAADELKVVLSGDGGDEVFAGYRRYRQWARQGPFDLLPQTIRSALFGGLSSMWPRRARGGLFVAGLAREPLERYASRLELFTPAEKRELVNPDWLPEFREYDDYWHLREFWRPELDPITRVQYLDLHTYLPDDILTKVDRASMKVSLEVRPPLLDHLLVEKVFSLGSEYRSPRAAPKHILKKACKDLLPEQIRKRRKKGFSAPWTSWVQREQSWVIDRLSGDSLASFLRPGLERHAVSESRGSRIWTLLVLARWLEARAGILRS